MIYLDNAATTKVSEEVINEMINYHSIDYANSSSKHVFGKKGKNIIDISRKKIADLIGCQPNDIYFNSGSTEGINTVLRGFVEANIEKGNHIITTKVEHKAVLEVCNYLESIGIDITYLSVNENGVINLKELEASIRDETILVSILWVNNETGVIQDLNSIRSIVSKFQAKLFLDATQAVGKIPVDIELLGVDMLCLSAHKFHGPKGVGALYINKEINIKPLLYGGGQENGFRSGTTNVPGVVGLAKACEIANIDSTKVKNVMEYLEKCLLEKFDCEIVGVNSKRSPYISNVLFKGVDADVVLGKLKNVIVSTGSACNSEINEPSHVLKNMNIDDQKAYGSIRFSISKHTTVDEIDLAIEELKTLIN